MTATRIDRRKALGVVAAAPAALALGVAPTLGVGEPGQLAALVRRYFAKIDVWTAFVRENELIVFTPKSNLRHS